MSEENTVTLSDSEQAFFSSGGETEIVEAPAPVETVEVEKPAVDTPELTQERDERGKFVPHGALHAEREEHKKTRSELNEIRAKQAVLEDRWNTLLKVQGEPAKQTDEDPAPDPNVDIFAFSAWQQRQVEKLNSKLSEREQQETQAKQVQERENAIWSEWQRSSAEYATQKPDFGDARTFLADLRDKQLSGLARVHPQFASKQGRDQQINQELAAIIVAAKQQNISPAEAVYEMATSWGYSVKQEQIDPGKMTMPDNLAKIAAAQEASKTLGQTNARGGSGELTAEAIAAMPETEFAAWMKSPENAARFTKMMGG